MHPNMIKIKLWKDVFSKAINALPVLKKMVTDVQYEKIYSVKCT